jgi:hypothetical protein
MDHGAQSGMTLSVGDELVVVPGSRSDFSTVFGAKK